MIPKPFQGLRTFCKGTDDTTRHYAVLGFPFDTATSYRPGARFGPAAIREASLQLTDGMHPTFGVNPSDSICDLGDAEITSGNTDRMLTEVEEVVRNVLSWNMHPVFLGGDHTVTLGILRAMNREYGKVAVVHFDAHCDTWSTNFDEPIGHGTWLYNAIEEGLVNPHAVVSIGVRSPSDPSARDYLDNHGGTTFTARYANSNIEAVITNIDYRIGDIPVYLSFDIDALDPAYAPGTGTPEIGGLTTMWVLECLEHLYQLNWIGMDMVEVSPAYDHANITSMAAATVCWTYICMLIAKSRVRIEQQDPDEIACGDSASTEEDWAPNVPGQGLQGPTGT